MSLAAHNATLITALGGGENALRADRMARRLREELIAEGGHLLELLPRPLFADPEEVRTLGAQARALVALQTRLIRELVAREGRAGLLDRFAVQAPLRDLLHWDELLEPRYLVARLDLLRLPTGFRCCEINVDSCVAGAEIFDAARDAMLDLGLEPAALPPRPLDQLAALVAQAARERGARRIVILDWSVGGGSPGKGYLSYERMRDAVQRASGIDVHIADELGFDPGWMQPAQASGTFVHRGFMMEEMHDGGAFLRRLRAAGVTVMSLLEADIRMDKGWFAAIWDACRGDRLTGEEAALVRGFVPETWQVGPHNLDVLLARRDELVFKARRSFGGAGILVGSETAPGPLREELERSGPENWIAQQMLRPERITMPHRPGQSPQPHEMVYGIYLYGSQANGLLLRGSTRSRVVNVTSGQARLSWAVAVSADDRIACLRRLAGPGAALVGR